MDGFFLSFIQKTIGLSIIKCLKNPSRELDFHGLLCISTLILKAYRISIVLVVNNIRAILKNHAWSVKVKVKKLLKAGQIKKRNYNFLFVFWGHRNWAKTNQTSSLYFKQAVVSDMKGLLTSSNEPVSTHYKLKKTGGFTLKNVNCLYSTE